MHRRFMIGLFDPVSMGLGEKVEKTPPKLVDPDRAARAQAMVRFETVNHDLPEMRAMRVSRAFSPKITMLTEELAGELYREYRRFWVWKKLSEQRPPHVGFYVASSRMRDDWIRYWDGGEFHGACHVDDDSYDGKICNRDFMSLKSLDRVDRMRGRRTGVRQELIRWLRPATEDEIHGKASR